MFGQVAVLHFYCLKIIKNSLIIDSISKISLAHHEWVWKPISCLKTWGCTIFNGKKPYRKSLTAGSSSCRSNVDCKLQSRPQDCGILRLTMKNLMLKVSNNDIEFRESWGTRYFFFGSFLATYLLLLNVFSWFGFGMRAVKTSVIPKSSVLLRSLS